MADQTTTPPVNTKVKLGGAEYELKNMSTATGLKLYEGLSADFQKQAKQIAEVVTVYAAVAETAEKNGLNPTELAQDWLRSAGNSDAAKAARKTFSSAKQTAIAQLEAAGIDVQSLANMVPGGSQILATANTAAGVGKAVGAVAGVVGAGVDGAWNGTSRMWDLLSTLGKEGWHQVVGYGSGAPKDNALAFGASVMALRQQSLDERHAKPMMDMPFNGQESQLEANPGAVTLSAWDAAVQWIKINVPGVIAFGRWLTTWGENKPSWDQFMAQAEEESRQLAGKQKDFQQLVDARLVGADSEHAKGVLEAAETVAGLKTQGLAHVASAATSGKVTYQDTKGDNVTLEQGQETHRVTPWDRVKEVGHAVVGDGSTPEQAVRGAAAVAATATVANNGVKGFVRGMTAAVSNPSPTTEGLMDWAKKPVQLGVGEHAITSGWKTWINFPGKIAVGVGDLAGRAVRGTVNAVAGVYNMAADAVTGGVKGVHEVVNDASTGAVSKTEKVSRFAFGTYAKYLPWAAPVAATTNTFEDIGKGDAVGATIHGVEAVGMGAAIKTVGLAGVARLSPYVAPVMATVEGVNAIAHDDKGGMVKAGAELGTIGSFAAAGAGVGAFFGGVGAVPGALVGATVGGIASIFTGTMAENYFVKDQSIIAKNDVQPHPGIAAAITEAHDKAEDARVKAAAAAKGLAMTGTSVAMGAVTQAPAGQPSGAHAPTQQQVVRIS